MTKKSSTVGKAVKRDKKQQPVKWSVRVHELAWTGRHAQAIETATQALADPKMKIAEQIDLIGLRAESHIAQGAFNLASKDADEMMQLSKISAPLFLARALICTANLKIHTGDLKDALQTAGRAVSIACTLGLANQRILAKSLYVLSEAQKEASDYKSAIATAQKAMKHFQSTEDVSGAGRASCIMAPAYNVLGHAKQSRRAAQTALDLCQQAGDQYGIGNAFNALSSTHTDIAERIRYYQQAIQAFETAGYLERQSTAIGNLGFVYFELGLYMHARRLTTKALLMSRKMGAKLGMAYWLENLFDTEVKLGDLDAARIHLQESAQLASGFGSPRMEANLETNFGILALAEGDPAAAVRHSQSAVKIIQRAAIGNENVHLTYLGRAHLQNGDPAAALAATTKATEIHRAQSFKLPDSFSTQEIWWRHAQALFANKKIKAAREALEQAHAFLLESIVSVRDEGLRRNYLNKVNCNRELLQFWVTDGTKRKLSKKRIFAHHEIETNAREPFKRLADTGLRLNTLHAVKEIQRFIVEETTELSGGERVILILEKDGMREVADSLLPRGEDTNELFRVIEPLLTNTATLIQPKKPGLNQIIAPLISQNRTLGYLYVDMDSLYGKFTEIDRDMLGMLANQAAVALDNVKWAQGLEQKVKERTEEIQEHVEELAIINSISQALTQELDLHSLMDLVGDKIRATLKTENIGIGLYHKDTNLLDSVYVYKNGERVYPKLTPLNAFSLRLARQGKSLVLRNVTEEIWKKFGSDLTFGADIPKSVVMIPILAGRDLIGGVTVQDFKIQNAYPDSMVHLLETIASNMGAAIQNAGLFDKTQRLLKETEQRNTELAEINKIQAGLVAEMNPIAMYELVGNRIHEIFPAQGIVLSSYNHARRQTQYHYVLDDGKRLYPEPTPFSYISEELIRTRAPLLINQNVGELEQKGVKTIQGTTQSKSVLFVPLVVGDMVQGVLQIADDYTENLFTDSDVRLLATLATSLSVALENARLFNKTEVLLKETQKRAQEFSAISTISQVLVTESELENMIHLIGNQLREIFDADIVYIALLDSRAKTLYFPYQYGESFITLNLGEGFASRIIRTGEPLLLNKDISKRVKEMTGIKRLGRESLSYLGVPIKSGKDTIGVISVQSTKREDVFDEDSLRLLTTIAASAGSAIHTAQLHAETQRRAREMSTLAEVGRDISSSLETSTVLEGIATHAKELLRGELSALFLPDEDGVTFRAIAAVGVNAEELRNDAITLGEGILGAIAKSKVGEIINDAGNDTRALTVIGTDDRSNEHMLVVPLLADDSLKGLMAVWRNGNGFEFTEFELEFLTNLSRQAVIAVKNTQLFAEAKELRIAAEQANKAKSTFMANMSHELRTPLNAIIGFTRIVRRKTDDLIPDKQIENLDKVLSSAEHLLGLINTVLDISKIEAGRMDVIPAKFTISALIDQCANLAAPLLKPTVILEKKVDDSVGIIYSDQDKIKQIVLNLLSNAAKFTEEGKIILSMKKADTDTIHIAVTDSGIGISEEALGRIFEEFQQADTSTTRKYGGTGLGLSISRNLAHLLGGDIVVESEVEKGSTFTLSIPLQYENKSIFKF